MVQRYESLSSASAFLATSEHKPLIAPRTVALKQIDRYI